MKRIVILLLVITGLYIIYNLTSQLDWFSSGSKNTKSAITEEVDTIEVNIASVSTTIIPEDREDLKAVYNGKENLTVREHGDTIEVFIKQKGFGLFNWSPFSEKRKLQIYIPEKYDQNMNIRLGSGNLSFSGQSKDKPMKLNNLTFQIGSGNMKLKNMNIKHLDQNVASGNVDLDSIITNMGSFDLSSGNLDVKHYKGEIHANVSSGELNIQVDKMTDPIDIAVSSGDVGLDLPNNADFSLEGYVSSGDIICELPLNSKNIKKRSIKGVHGTGKYKIDLKVSSGDIHLR